MLGKLCKFHQATADCSINKCLDVTDTTVHAPSWETASLPNLWNHPSCYNHKLVYLTLI